MGKKKELKLKLLFGSNFHSRLERRVTNAPFAAELKATASVRQLFYQ